ncbi:MAG TPA: FAD-dependent oxidoreductase [Devosiaceae bacterium]|nr:FAD-dependent oxidoreductase [Devosiaceae bacterium]
MADRILETRCAIAGGGPAGMMLGFLLARAGIDVTVLEKHADFFRDFRGDTIHPSTLELMAELGLLEKFLALPHQEVRELWAQIGPDRLPLADFSRIHTRCKFIALMPQWDFLNFLADEARAFPNFHLLMETEATGLIEEGGKVVGISATGPDGPLDIRAPLSVACDGRHSTLREAARLEVEDFGAPMDVLWFRVSRQESDPADTFGHAEAGRLMVLLNRGDYWQCAYIIRKGSRETLENAGIEKFRADVAAISPFLAGRMEEIKGWDDVKLLTVKVDRLARWHRPGLLLIGDAAHAMSPIGGVGVNLAVQDAVAAANIVARPLAGGDAADSVLAEVERRREFPTKVVQAMQTFIQKRLIGALLDTSKPLHAPRVLRLLAGIPALRGIPARFVGIGVRPEHIRTGVGHP